MNIFSMSCGFGYVKRIGLAVSFMLLSPLVQAQVIIEKVEGFLQGGVEAVRIYLNQPLDAPPAGFAIQAPARIALDFPGVSSGLRPRQDGIDHGNLSARQEIKLGNLQSVSVVQVGNHSRVVLSLIRPVAYRTELEATSKSLLVVLEKPDASVTGSTRAVFAENLARNIQSLKSIDFRRDDGGAGTVIVELPNNQVGVDIRRQGQALVVEFMNSMLPESLRSPLDVSDFGTPVKTVRMKELGDRVQMVIEPHGNWTHSAYQSDRRFVIAIRAETETSKKESYTKNKLSLNFQSIDIRALLHVMADYISEFMPLNIVTSDKVSGSVTLRLQDVPWDQAFDIILQTNGLGKVEKDNIIWVAPIEEISKQKSTLIDNSIQYKIYSLKYALAEDIAKSLNRRGEGASTTAGSGQLTAVSGDNSYQSTSSASRTSFSDSRILSPRGNAFSEKRTNQVIVFDTLEKLAQVDKLLVELDVPLRQILIEARIVEANDSFGRALGVKLGATDARAQQGGDGGYSLGGGNRVAIGTNYGNAVASSGAGGSVDLTSNFVNLPALPSVGQAATFGLSIFSAAANRFLNLELSALESDGKGKVVSSPRIVTANLMEAVIEQGEELPYQTVSKDGQPSVAFKKINLKLSVKPQITPEGNVLLTLDINKDTVGRLTSQGFGLETKHVQTQVMVENGGTVVIGGIFYLTENDDEVKVPFLGDLPGVGNLFKNRSKTSQKKELLVFVTPKMMSDKSLR